MNSRLSYRFSCNKRPRFFYFDGAKITKAVFVEAIFRDHDLDRNDCMVEMHVIGERQHSPYLHRNARVLLYRLPLENNSSSGEDAEADCETESRPY